MLSKGKNRPLRVSHLRRESQMVLTTSCEVFAVESTCAASIHIRNQPHQQGLSPQNWKYHAGSCASA
jgi:hypothetical protein